MKIEHLPINWVNGVKLTKDHFFGNYYNMIESLYGSIESQLISMGSLSLLFLKRKGSFFPECLSKFLTISKTEYPHPVPKLNISYLISLFNI